MLTLALYSGIFPRYFIKYNKLWRKIFTDLHQNFAQIVVNSHPRKENEYEKEPISADVDRAINAGHVCMMKCRFHRWTLLIIWMTCSVIALQETALADAGDNLALGDQAWSQRAVGHQGSRGATEPIQKAIEAYTSALEEEPDNLKARWKLLRAFYFKGEFALENNKDRLALYKTGREIAEVGRLQIESDYGLSRSMFKMSPAEVAEAVGDQVDVAEFCFWATANWGLWGQYSGKLISALAGLVYKLRQFAEIMVLMDESVENGGGHRLLGQLNARVPKIPFFTWWVDHDLAISELRLSLKVAPNSLLSKIFLAQALLKYRTTEKEEALDLLQDIVKSDPDPDRLVEDIRVIEDARALLADNLR
jgi:tetratricopeptide (TPR) repeat protein